MPKSFVYKERKPDTITKRADAKGPGDFENFISSEFLVYSPKDGENFIRILPPTWDDPDHYGLTIYAHYGVGPDRAAVLCNNKMGGKKCPICDARVKAERAKADEEVIRELKVTTRVLVWLLDMNDEDKGPQLWAMPFTVDRDICKISRDRRSGETYQIDHHDEGYNISFDKQGKQRNTKYSGFQLDRKESSVDQEWLEYISRHPVPDTITERSYDIVKALFEGGLPDEDEAQEEKPARSRLAADGRRRDDDADEERPARRRVAQEAPEEQDERTRRRAAREEPEEKERPARRSRLAQDLDDEIPFEKGAAEKKLPPHDAETGEIDDERPARRRLAKEVPEEQAEQPRSRAEGLRERYRNRN
jgi:hypothetical protein